MIDKLVQLLNLSNVKKIIYVDDTELSQVSSTRPERAEAPSPGHRPG